MNTRTTLKYSILLFYFITLKGIFGVQAQQASFTKQDFKNFIVNVKEKKISINWATDTNVSTNYFEVQKSNDGIIYKTILLVLGPDPKQMNCSCYGCFDKLYPNASPHCFYRLVHVNIDGTDLISEAKQPGEEQREVAQK